ncbi:hypothetical protein ALC62_12035, partial [Cyphomyrmex costatus]
TRCCPKKSISIERRAIKRKRPRKLIIVGIAVPYQPFVRHMCDSIIASDGVATQPRLNHKLGVRYDPFYLGCIGATAEVERKPDASESSQLPTFRATAAAGFGNALSSYLHFTEIIVILIKILMRTVL